MSCNHKFQSYLNLERLDFEPTTLIVGTFNPEWPVGNTAEWFYGRTHDDYGNQNNNFWAVLPRLYGEPSLIDSTPREWKRFCKRKLIAITDLVASIEDADNTNADHVKWLSTYSDSNVAGKFQKHVSNPIDQLLQNHASIKNVYLTRGIGPTFWKQLWRPVKQYPSQKDFRACTLITPSGYAFYQHGRYNRQHPENRIATLEDYILMRWQKEWHF